MEIIFFSVSLVASIIGAICGIGGGVIIKPALDATGVMSVSSISFLSGCTVFAMAIISVSKQIRNNEDAIDIKTGTPLAIGAAIGGIAGKEMFKMLYYIFNNENTVGMIQSILLATITLATLIYTINQRKIKTYDVKNIIACLVIGLFLGVMSSFLGIGGGPINLVVLSFFFSMSTKKAAANSLYIILFSQITSLLSYVVQDNIPSFKWSVLVLMVLGGVLGGSLGSKINKRISSNFVEKLFIILMIFIILINIYNSFKFCV
nr:sulfite exporter TauE/SafE family protein [uncultured Niameybacter sp.]